MGRTEDGDGVAVIGGGLAGISAALELAEAGLAVTLVEARPWLGGATCSFARRGLTIDNGQHAFLRCFTAYRDLLARLVVTSSCSIQEQLDLTVLAPGAQARIRRSGWPAPLHLARALAGYRLLSARERASVAATVLLLQLSDLSGSQSVAASLGGWLSAHGQGEHARRMFWDVAAGGWLNAGADDADLALAASAMRTALLARRDSADIGTASVPLSRLHGRPAADLLAGLGVDIRLGVAAASVQADRAGRYRIALAAGQGSPTNSGQRDDIGAAGVVLAVPPWEAASLAPDGLGDEAGRWAQLQPCPMVSIHVIFGSRVTDLPFAAVAGSPVRWIMDKTRAAGLYAGQYLAATVPAAGQYVDARAAQLREEFLPELERLIPAAAAVDVEDFFVTRERRATIAQVPGSRRLRSGQDGGPAGFAVAGAWTDTGWPDTMEGAVRSGRAAARKLIADLPPQRARAAIAAWPGEVPAQARPDQAGSASPARASRR